MLLVLLFLVPDEPSDAESAGELFFVLYRKVTHGFDVQVTVHRDKFDVQVTVHRNKFDVQVTVHRDKFDVQVTVHRDKFDVQVTVRRDKLTFK